MIPTSCRPPAWFPLLALAERAGLGSLAEQHLTVPTDKGTNAGLKVSSLVAGMVAGADSIDDMALLRHGGMGRVFAKAYAPSTLGSFVARVSGFRRLQPFLDDPAVEEVWINDPSRVFVARHGRHEPINLGAEPRRRYQELVERMLKLSGRREGLSQPFVDAVLPGGHRLHIVLEGISRGFSAVNIRKFVLRANRLQSLVGSRASAHALGVPRGERAGWAEHPGGRRHPRRR